MTTLAHMLLAATADADNPETTVTQPVPPTAEPDYPRDVPPEVLAMADVTVLRIHELLDGAPLALVVNAYRRGVAAGRTAAAADIRAHVARWQHSPNVFTKEMEAMRTASRIAEQVKP